MPASRTLSPPPGSQVEATNRALTRWHHAAVACTLGTESVGVLTLCTLKFGSSHLHAANTGNPPSPAPPAVPREDRFCGPHGFLLPVLTDLELPSPPGPGCLGNTDIFLLCSARHSGSRELQTRDLGFGNSFMALGGVGENRPLEIPSANKMSVEAGRVGYEGTPSLL